MAVLIALISVSVKLVVKSNITLDSRRMFGVAINRSIFKKTLKLSVFFYVFIFYSDHLFAECGFRPSLPSYRVDRVVDGDTVRLTNGEKVRLIGVNTPELKRDDRPAEPLADVSTQFLDQLLIDRQIFIREGEKNRDRYGRLLAYVYTGAGKSAEQALLENGLGFVVAIPPNLGLVVCLQAAEAVARSKKLGVWRHPNWQPSSADADLVGGFQRITARVERVTTVRDGWWVDLEGNVALRLQRNDQAFFPSLVFSELSSNLVGKKILVRGWLIDRSKRKHYNPRYKRWMMWLRHPTMVSW